MKPVAYHPEARGELDQAASFYFKREPQAAREFLTILAQVVSEIQAAPQRWPFHEKTFVQRRHLRKFPYTVFYGNESDQIFILAIAHASRRPGYWKMRIAVD